MAPSIWSASRKSPGRPSGGSDVRTAFEQDYDRLLFSTPVRRLADKTQVFPLERNDSVRPRLTHSHEVSNLSKSIGVRLIRTDKTLFGDNDDVREAVPAILAAIGLAHALGMRAVAEGVETAEQLAFLNDHQCDVIQGFFVGRPVPVEDLPMVGGRVAARRRRGARASRGGRHRHVGRDVDPLQPDPVDPRPPADRVHAESSRTLPTRMEKLRS